MANHERDEDGMDALYRMIAYVRDEALRLRMMDVAALLQHAETAARSFAAAEPDDEMNEVSDPSRMRPAH